MIPFPPYPSVSSAPQEGEESQTRLESSHKLKRGNQRGGDGAEIQWNKTCRECFFIHRWSCSLNLIFAFASVYANTYPSSSSSLSLRLEAVRHMRATRATKPGKLNQRISRIYRHVIPGLPRMHAHEVSLNLRPNISPLSPSPNEDRYREKNHSLGRYRSFDLVPSSSS